MSCALLQLSQVETSSQPHVAILEVEIKQAMKLPVMDEVGLSDPYCQVQLGTCKHKTPVKHLTVSPKWGFKCRFKVTPADLLSTKLVKFNLYDEDVGPSVQLSRTPPSFSSQLPQHFPPTVPQMYEYSSTRVLQR